MSEECAIAGYPGRVRTDVRYSDTDRQGHVNHAIFSTMFEIGRVDIVLSRKMSALIGLDSFALVRTEIDFLGEMHWPGFVDIGSRITSIGRSSLSFDQSLFQDEKRISMARSVVVLVDAATRRSKLLSDRMRDVLTDWLNAGEGT